MGVSTWLALGLALVMLWLDLSFRNHDTRAHSLSMVFVLLLLAALSLQRSWRHAWRCPACGLTARPRLYPTAPIAPLVVIPTYNNRGSIRDVVTRTLKATRLPLLVVDDGSTDGTGDLAAELLAQTEGGSRGEVQRHDVNCGKGEALRTALRFAVVRGHSHILTLDGDGQQFPEELPRMEAAVRASPEALQIGARDLSGPNVTGTSRFGRAFSNFWVRVQTGRRLTDSQSGFRAYPSASTLALGASSQRFAFEVEILNLAGRAGMPIHELPIRVHYPRLPSASATSIRAGTMSASRSSTPVFCWPYRCGYWAGPAA